MSAKFDTFLAGLGIVGLTLVVLFLLACLLFWWWVVWIVASIVVACIGYTGPYLLYLQIFVWVVLLLFTGMLGRIGGSVVVK